MLLVFRRHRFTHHLAGDARKCGGDINWLGARPFCELILDQSSVGRSTTSESHRARDSQHESKVGDTPGSLRSDPAGIIISRPLRVACGSGLPQFRQNEVEKLRAVGRSKRVTLSSPDNQWNARGKTYAFALKVLPVAASRTMAPHKFAERQVGFKFNRSTEASATHGHIAPIGAST
jgi:hypothetical protein